MASPNFSKKSEYSVNVILDVTFGLLEQFLPDGPDHPFAKTMLRHFEKLRTPLRSVRTYPTEKCQRQRFLDTGWKAVKFVNLWKLWSSHEFLTLPERMRMNDLEPFDEWEEFALFAAHYFLLTASTSQEQNQGNAVVEKATSSSPSHPAITFALQYTSIPDQSTFRLHGAALALPAGALSDPARVAFVGGMTSQGRSSKVALYQPTKGTRKSTPCCSTKVHARQCHTITRLPNETSLLVGGRASPSAAMQDCYLQTIDGWQQVQDLPEPRYRHSAVGVEACGIDAVLIVGGKSGPNTIQGDILLWDSFHGWRDIPVSGQAIVPRFGATLIGLAHNFGLLVGGMDCNGVILQEKWTWKLNDTDESNTSIEFNLCLCAGDPSAGQYLARFGAKTIRMKYREPGALLNDGALVIGGIGTTACLPQECEILALNRRLVSQTTPPHPPAVILSRVILRRPTDTPRPLFIGHTATGGENGQTLLIGGGAVCFSFGTYWNAGIFYLRHSSYPESDDWTLVQSEKKVNKETEYPGISKNKSEQISHDLKHVSKMSLESAHSFAEMVKSSHPIILEQIDLGSCVQKWNRDYLEHKIGRDRQVVVHEATSRCMHFLRKDFSYVSKPFGDFLSDIQQGAHQYLRSISSSEPSRKVADLGQDFPEIADDFKLPPLLADVVNLYHSSPLRITGDVTMWLHVDTMANILCQIVGSKRIILFPPEDMVKLEFPPGATTSDLDIFPQPGESHMPLRMPPGTHPYEAVIRPGEVLFIPPLWAHTTTPTGANVDADAGDHNGQISIAVNVFFRSLSEGYAPGKDIYGNRDLMAYERGRRHLSQIVNGFDKLPDDLGRAYLLRLADELRAKATEYGGKSGTP